MGTVHTIGGAPSVSHYRSKVIIDQSPSLRPSLLIKGLHQSKSIPPSVIIDQRSLLIKVHPSVRHYQSKVIIDQSLFLCPSLSIKVHYRSKSVLLSVIIDQRSLSIKVRSSVRHY